MKNLHGRFERFTDIYHAKKTPPPSPVTDHCLLSVGIDIKCTFETSQRVWSRAKKKNASGPVNRRTIITEHTCAIEFW